MESGKRAMSDLETYPSSLLCDSTFSSHSTTILLEREVLQDMQVGTRIFVTPLVTLCRIDSCTARRSISQGKYDGIAANASGSPYAWRDIEA